MRLLLDTHVYLWCLSDSPRLSKQAKARILQAEEVFVSAASIWEAAIKSALGRLQVDPEALANGITASGYRELPVTARHAAMAARLPLHHRDPFDRMLIAQAIDEPMRLLTLDAALKPHSDLVVVI